MQTTDKYKLINIYNPYWYFIKFHGYLLNDRLYRKISFIRHPFVSVKKWRITKTRKFFFKKETFVFANCITENAYCCLLSLVPLKLVITFRSWNTIDNIEEKKHSEDNVFVPWPYQNPIERTCLNDAEGTLDPWYAREDGVRKNKDGAKSLSSL